MSERQFIKISKCPRLLVRCLALAGLAMVFGTGNATTSYTVTNLSLGGTFSLAYAANAKGQVAGRGYLPGNAALHAFRFNGSVMEDLGILAGTRFSSASAINEAGQVAGISETPAIFSAAFIYSGGLMQDLGSLGGTVTKGTAIDAIGQVVGRSNMSGDIAYHAFRYNGA